MAMPPSLAVAGLVEEAVRWERSEEREKAAADQAERRIGKFLGKCYTRDGRKRRGENGVQGTGYRVPNQQRHSVASSQKRA
jgi:hypothetical protein